MSATNGSPGTQRVALYARVSTDKQAEKYGLDAQTHGLTRRSAERGYEVVPDGEQPAFADDGFSGGDLHRPALDRLRQAVGAGRADIVLAYDPDRLSRNLKDLLFLADEFERAGVRLECMTQEVDASPEGQMFFAIRGAVAQYEKAKIRERTARGRKEKAEQGKVVLPRNLPCWLRSDDGGATVYVDEEHWAPIVRRAFALFQVTIRCGALDYWLAGGGWGRLGWDWTRLDAAGSMSAWAHWYGRRKRAASRPADGETYVGGQLSTAIPGFVRCFAASGGLIEN